MSRDEVRVVITIVLLLVPRRDRSSFIASNCKVRIGVECLLQQERLRHWRNIVDSGFAHYFEKEDIPDVRHVSDHIDFFRLRG